MAKIINVVSKEEREVIDNDNDSLKNAAEQLNVLFGCEDGKCGSCRVEIIDGMKNLTKLTKNEIEFPNINGPYRLLCQCKIKNGEVKIRPD